MISEFQKGRSPEEVHGYLSDQAEFAFLFADHPETIPSDDISPKGGKKFTRDTKGAAFLRDALPSAPKCPTCGGILHHNAMQTGHKRHRREGGTGDLGNAMMQHPFCNSTVKQ